MVTTNKTRAQFLQWQCLIRQRAVRHHGGIPNSGMQPMIRFQESGNWLGPITVLISKTDPSDMTAQFRFIAKKNHDPRERMDSALKHLAEAYYQRPSEFNDKLTALFSLNSVMAKQLLEAETVTLRIGYANQEYHLPCKSQLLKREDPLFQFTYWHNFLFNPTLPGRVDIVAFRPAWDQVVYRESVSQMQ